MSPLRHRAGRIGAWALVIFLWVLSRMPVLAMEMPGFGAETVSAGLEKILTGAGENITVPSNGLILRSSNLMRKFYATRQFEPAWVTRGNGSPGYESVLDTLEAARAEGLNPDNYHRDEIASLLAELKGKPATPGRDRLVEKLIELELLLTDAHFLLGCHYSTGWANPVKAEAECFATAPPVDLVHELERATDRPSPSVYPQKFLPARESYKRLRAAYERHLRLDRWGTVSDGPILRRGDGGPRVAQLRHRLFSSGDLVEVNDAAGLFDRDLERGLRAFQQRHGLSPDGMAGPKTIRALNVPARDRAEQIRVNLERLRWMPRELGEMYVMVNIADFSLVFVQNNIPILRMNVVVGKPFWHTPVFSDRLSYLIVNPWWNVPASIADEELIPVAQKDPDVLKSRGFTLFRGWGEEAVEVPVESVHWRAINGARFPYRFAQAPGPDNPLGRLKFMFPNRFNVYLHDSPARNLFASDMRALSHGCIRLEHPVDLATLLLRGPKNDWDEARLQAVMASGATVEVALPKPVNIHIVYLTAWVDEKGVLQFREDVYQRDDALRAALDRPPGSVAAVTSKPERNEELP